MLSKFFSTIKKEKLEFCSTNLNRFANEDFIHFIEEHFPKTLKEYSCLSECEICVKQLYVKKSGKILSAPSEDLIHQLRK